MIGKLTGSINSANQNPLIIDVHDVGYLVHVTPGFLSSLQIGKNSLWIHPHIREDAFDLYGFKTQKDLLFFELLLTVSGIGPKTALLVIDRGVSEVEIAVKAGDVTFFTTIPRLGTKNAQKIIIELKGKLDLTEESSGETKQMTQALVDMGFRKHEVIEVLGKIDADMSLEEKMRRALKLLGK